MATQHTAGKLVHMFGKNPETGKLNHHLYFEGQEGYIERKIPPVVVCDDMKTAQAFIDRWNAFEPGGKVERMERALRLLLEWNEETPDHHKLRLIDVLDAARAALEVTE